MGKYLLAYTRRIIALLARTPKSGQTYLDALRALSPPGPALDPPSHTPSGAFCGGHLIQTTIQQPQQPHKAFDGAAVVLI